WKVAQIEGRRMGLSLDGRLATFTLFSNENNDSPQQPPRAADAEAGNVSGQAPQTAPAPSTSQPTESQTPPPPRRHRNEQVSARLERGTMNVLLLRRA